MKFEPVTKLDKRNMTISKKIEDDVLSANCDVNCNFSNLWPIWSNPKAEFEMHGLQYLQFH